MVTNLVFRFHPLALTVGDMGPKLWKSNLNEMKLQIANIYIFFAFFLLKAISVNGSLPRENQFKFCRSVQNFRRKLSFFYRELSLFYWNYFCLFWIKLFSEVQNKSLIFSLLKYVLKESWERSIFLSNFSYEKGNLVLRMSSTFFFLRKPCERGWWRRFTKTEAAV